MTPLPLLLLLAFALTSAVVAQFGVTFTIEVGRNGSFYIPDSVNARVGDTVLFRFFDAAHGVVQTSFDNPCVPLEGGFSSGVAVPVGNAVVEWPLQITNLSTIWFFCPVRTPVLHCSTGMVGAINPLGESQVDQFKAAAKAFTGPPPAVTTGLSGVGATASTTPTTSVVSSGSPTPATTSAGPNATSSFPPKVPSSEEPTSTPGSSSSNHTAAVVGGTVAGLVALFATIIIVVVILRRRPRRSGQQQQPPPTHPTVETHYFPSAASPRPPSSGAADSFVGKLNPSPPANQTQFQPFRPEDALPSVGYGYSRNDSDPTSGTTNSRNQVPYHVRNQSSQGHLAPLRPIPSSDVLHQHPYAAAGVDAVDSDIYEPEQRPENISALAKEVAAVLLRGQSLSQINDSGSQGRDETSQGSDSPRRKPTIASPTLSDGPPPDYKSRGHSTHHGR